MYLTILTIVHEIICFAAILAGSVVMCGLLAGKRLDGGTAVFLSTLVATIVTGFFFPVHHFMPSHAPGDSSESAGMIKARRANERGVIERGWLEGYHAF